MTPLISAQNVVKHFPVRSAFLRRVVGHVRAVDGVTLTVGSGETVGLVGESGSGKSTLGRLMVRLQEPTAGSVHFEGTDITHLKGRELRGVRRRVQVVFQDPYSSMDPLATITDSLAEPLRTHLDLKAGAREERIGELLTMVGLTPDHAHRHPREFSGGQLQRIAIARALALDPDLLVLDEPVSSLDVSIQADVINLLQELQARMGIAFLFIAHDLAVVRHVSDRIAVMYLGRIVEEGPASEVFDRARHPYTKALLSAIPIPHPRRQRARERTVLVGDIPSPVAPPSGCRFHTRCPEAMEICSHVDPDAHITDSGTTVYCHLYTDDKPAVGESSVQVRSKR